MGVGADSSRVMGAEATMSVSEGQHGKQLHGTGDRKQIMSTFRGYYGGLSLPADECCGSLRQHANLVRFHSASASVLSECARSSRDAFTPARTHTLNARCR